MPTHSYRSRYLIAFVLTLAVVAVGTQLLTRAHAAATRYTLTFTRTGAGKVTSDPKGLRCASDGSCVGTFRANSSVKINASPAAGNAFGSWGGDCSSAEGHKCKLRMTSDHAGDVTFVPTYKLKMDVQGPGKVVSDPAGIKCEKDCSATYREGTHVTLIPKPDDHAHLESWTGDCDGVSTDATCQLDMNAAASAGAVFSNATSTATDTATAE